MNISVFGSGMVGRALSAKLVERRHDVVLGTRDVEALLARTEAGMGGRVPPFADWHRDHSSVQLAPFAEAAERADLIFNATAGEATLDVLKSAGEANLDGKILIDVANALDHSTGFPPTLFVSNTESLAEQIQAMFGGAMVVKSLNTVTADVMVEPDRVAGGDHHVFVSGNDQQAKDRVVELLKTDFGWRNVIDLGDITTARGPEMYLALWLRLLGSLETSMFNIKVAR
jgi:8-hydroxy-5-deazaflavin:NADPH oxidoreductase